MAGDKGTSMPKSRMFLLVLFKSLKVRRNRVAITFFSIMIGAAIITALSSVYFDISAKMSRELRAYGANFFIGPAASSGNRNVDRQTIDDAIKMVPREKLVGASTYIYGLVRLDLGNAVMAGVDFPGLRKLSPYWQVEGKWIAVDFDEDSCMIGKNLARNMELKVGDSVNVIKNETGFQKSLTVKGIVETGQAEDEQIFVNLSLAGRILGQAGKVNHAMLSIVTEGTDIDGLAAGMQKSFPGLDAKPIRKVSYSDGKILDKIKGLMAIVAVIILTVTTLCVMTTLIAIVSERTREIGLMKAIGADDRDIARQFLAETLIMGVAGVAAGLAAGFILAQVLGQAVFGSYISFRLIVVPMTLVPSVAASLLAAAIPVRMAVRVVPAQVLKED
ncbi:FtsX-like permease family protein [Geobacter sp.]|uniref:ABC transporter permease n=1 Tax=Geobacter sp. TaxID=46610 RepID=UPI002609CF5E|nr:FtsX-like permease family protein [Geobacter sp.]